MQGRHIKVVGKGKPEALASKDTVESFIADIVHAVGMRPAIAPFVYDNVDAKCITGFVVLPTSHAVVHTWSLDKLLMFDLFAPHQFHDLTVVAAVVRHFGLAKYAVRDLTNAMCIPG